MRNNGGRCLKMSKRPRFKVGDTIFYPSAGVGVIQSIEEIYTGGEFRPCLVIRIPETRMTVKVPHVSSRTRRTL